MNALFGQTMTVYNYRKGASQSEDTWKRTVINGVQWMHNRNEVSTSNGVQTENKVESITIDFGHSYGNKPYLPPKEYKKLSDDERDTYWTLDASAGQDILVLGETEQEITADYRIKHLREEQQCAVIIKSVTDNRHMPRLKHIKVVGKQ